MTSNKLKIGWFSFTCCEDSTILFTEILNDNFDKWKNLVDFQHFKALKTNNKLEGLDVAFVEGAISSDKQAAELKKIRDNCKYLIAIGACAVTGSPSSSRNAFTQEEVDFKIAYYMSHFDYSQNVKKLDELVKVDDAVNGCPMSRETFIQTLEKYLKIFNLIS